MKKSVARKLAISFLMVLLPACTACGSETIDYQVSYETSAKADSTGVSPDNNTLSLPVDNTTETADTITVNPDLPSNEKREWVEYFRKRMTHLLPSFKMGEEISDMELISFSANYIVWCAEEGQGFEMEKAYYEKLAYEINRIKEEYVEEVAKLLFSREVKTHETAGVFIYDAGYYWVIPHGYELGVLPRIMGYRVNTDGTITFDIEYYYVGAELKMHTEDDTELGVKEFEEKALDESAKFKEEAFMKKRLTLNTVNEDSGQRYIILENAIY